MEKEISNILLEQLRLLAKESAEAIKERAGVNKICRISAEMCETARAAMDAIVRQM